MVNDKISHEGIIKGITQETVLVSIISQSACNECHSKGFCNVSGSEEKIIEVKNPNSNEHKQGDHVMVTMQRKMGMRAVLWGYFFPFFIMLATLIITVDATKNELISGLAAIVILAPYYLGLYFFRNQLKSAFSFKIETR